MVARRYTRFVMSACAVVMLLILASSWLWVRQPQTGDLARIGGYVESAFESRDVAPRLGFEQPLFRFGDEGAGEAVDVLVIGDSFSYTGGRYNWVSQFAARTGLRIRVASIHRWWDSWRALEKSAQSPPLVVLQTVERDAVDHLAGIHHRLGSAAPAPGRQPWTPRPTPDPVPGALAVSPLPVKTFDGFDDRVSVTTDVLWKSLRRRLGLARPELVTFRRGEAGPTLFSARQQADFVTIPADLASQRPAPRRLRRAMAGWDLLRDRIRAAGGAEPALLVIPNRLSVYAPWLRDVPGVLDDPLARRLSAATASFDAVTVLRSAVAAGVEDIYWAMDTHLSAVGAAVLAEEFIRWLQAAEAPARAIHD